MIFWNSVCEVDRWHRKSGVRECIHIAPGKTQEPRCSRWKSKLTVPIRSFYAVWNQFQIISGILFGKFVAFLYTQRIKIHQIQSVFQSNQRTKKVEGFEESSKIIPIKIFGQRDLFSLVYCFSKTLNKTYEPRFASIDKPTNRVPGFVGFRDKNMCGKTC